ncbi:hypothetical protein BOO86_05320 [Mycobacterium sp. CBMA 234]|nr:hypothetical protein [Mycolicibacterium sp. CBMA 234]
MTSTLGAAVALVTPAVLIGGAATAHADTVDQNFQSPSGNIACSLTFVPPGPSVGSGGNAVQCDVGDHTWPAPQPRTNCLDTGGDTVILRAGGGPVLACHRGSLVPSSWPALEYGQTRSAGTITCDSETSGMTCTDSSTGHFFRMSRDSYEVG